jgi:hypothetical protein
MIDPLQQAEIADFRAFVVEDNRDVRWKIQKPLNVFIVAGHHEGEPVIWLGGWRGACLGNRRTWFIQQFLQD